LPVGRLAGGVPDFSLRFLPAGFLLWRWGCDDAFSGVPAEVGEGEVDELVEVELELELELVELDDPDAEPEVEVELETVELVDDVEGGVVLVLVLVVVVAPAAGVGVQLSFSDTTTPVIGRFICEIGVPAGTLTLKV
jgi:hypothetical protein